MSAERCPRCGAIAGPDGVLHHGLVHRRHEAGGGGVNVPCPNTPAATAPSTEGRDKAAAFMALALASYCVFVVWQGGGMGASVAAALCLLAATWLAGRGTR